MKHITSTLILTALLFSCGNKEVSVDELVSKGSLTELRAKKKELSQKQSQLKNDLSRIDEKIDALDDNKIKSIVTTLTLKDTTFTHYVEMQGDVQTDQNLIIYPQFSGTLTQVLVKEGQKVSKGQLLARIDDGGLSSQLAQVQTQTALAQTTFERQERLWEQKIGSEIQYLQAKTNYEASKNSYDQLKAQYGKTNITAPFSGVIDEIISDQGSTVNPGQTPIMRIINLDDMYVKADVPESYLGKISEGSNVKVQFSSIDKIYDGKIRQVANFINPDNRSFSIQVALPNADQLLKPNLIATIKLNDYSATETIIIPNNIIQRNSANESLVFLYEPKDETSGTVKRIKIKTGKEQGGKVEVLEGLKTGDIVINEGARTLRDGQEVSLKTESNE